MIPGTAPLLEIKSGIDLSELVIWFIVSSYKITPPIQSFILSELKRVSLKASLFFGVESTPTASSLFVIVPLLSSAASIPLPFESILTAILFSSDILT